jgi:hypothetical protein
MVIAINFEDMFAVVHAAWPVAIEPFQKPIALVQYPAQRFTAAQSDAKVNITGPDALHCCTHLLIGSMKAPRKIGHVHKQDEDE